MTATLPDEVQRVFDRFVTTEFGTIDPHGAPIAWPVTPWYSPGDECIDVTTGLGYPKKAYDAKANPSVSLLFSDPTGCDIDGPPMVLVQGTAEVDDRDLQANRERYQRETAEKLPATLEMQPPKPLRKLFDWYFTRLYMHVRPQRVFIWPGGDPFAEPELWDALLEEVRSGHDEVPDAPHTPPEGGQPTWHARLDELGSRYPTAVLSIVAPDGFPFSIRVPVRSDRGAGLIRFDGEPVGAPLQPGLACVTAHDHSPDFTWQRNFQVRGDLVREDGGWAVVPHKVVSGFELPPESKLQLYRTNARKILRFRRTAKDEFARRGMRT